MPNNRNIQTLDFVHLQNPQPFLKIGKASNDCMILNFKENFFEQYTISLNSTTEKYILVYITSLSEGDYALNVDFNAEIKYEAQIYSEKESNIFVIPCSYISNIFLKNRIYILDILDPDHKEFLQSFFLREIKGLINRIKMIDDLLKNLVNREIAFFISDSWECFIKAHPSWYFEPKLAAIEYFSEKINLEINKNYRLDKFEILKNICKQFDNNQKQHISDYIKALQAGEQNTFYLLIKSSSHLNAQDIIRLFQLKYNISKKLLDELFFEITGKTFSQYFLSFKFSTLQIGDYPSISSAAHSNGYKNVATFRKKLAQYK